MKKRFTSLLVALSLVVIGMMSTTVSAGATQHYVGTDDPRCPPWSQETYVGSHWASGSDGRNTVYVYIDVREAQAYGGHCYDYFAYTAAVPSQSVNTSPLRLRVWVCGSFNSDIALGNSWNDTIISGAKFYAYGCGPQADDYGTAAGTYGGYYYAHPYVSW